MQPWQGSFPLARGGRHNSTHSRTPARLIPARAGRTIGAPNGPTSAWTHPRSRGADHRSAERADFRVDSSPLARGGPPPGPPGSPRRRLIPARAGRTALLRRLFRAETAHPRSRGADHQDRALRRGLGGSSPLARGGQAGVVDQLLVAGLIPARAGRTTARSAAHAARPAHPRSRGADDDSGRGEHGRAGSSPLARGGPRVAAPGPPELRLIPARAGRTTSKPPACSPARAHPRSRGADDSYTGADAYGGGSSPLARGGRCDGGSGEAGHRLIPARAGRTPV